MAKQQSTSNSAVAMQGIERPGIERRRFVLWLDRLQDIRKDYKDECLKEVSLKMQKQELKGNSQVS